MTPRDTKLPKHRNPARRRAVHMATDQYRELREKLATTEDISEKNLIFRRLINLLDVIEDLNSGHSETYKEKE